MNKVRFGIIGYGNMGGQHVKYLSDGIIEGAVLSAVCDINPDKIKAAKSFLSEKHPELEIYYYEDYNELLKSGKIDAVIIATPHYLHPTIGIEAFKNNIQGNENMSDEDFEKVGFNDSVNHVDFMIGSEDLEIIGTDFSGNQTPIFKNGVWAI